MILEKFFFANCHCYLFYLHIRNHIEKQPHVVDLTDSPKLEKEKASLEQLEQELLGRKKKLEEVKREKVEHQKIFVPFLEILRDSIVRQVQVMSLVLVLPVLPDTPDFETGNARLIEMREKRKWQYCI